MRTYPAQIDMAGHPPAANPRQTDTPASTDGQSGLSDTPPTTDEFLSAQFDPLSAPHFCQSQYDFGKTLLDAGKLSTVAYCDHEELKYLQRAAHSGAPEGSAPRTKEAEIGAPEGADAHGARQDGTEPQALTPKDQKCSSWQLCANRKRPRATYEQLSVLERTFQTNSLPSAKVREALSRQLQMKPRSIRIWFQNRRAKEKLSKRRAEERLAGCAALPPAEQPPRSRIVVAGCFGCADSSSQHLRGHPPPQHDAQQHAVPPQYAFPPTAQILSAAQFDPYCLQPARPAAPTLRGLPFPRTTVPLHLSVIGSWRIPSAQGSEVSLTFDTANRTLELNIQSQRLLCRIVSQATSISSIHFTRVHPGSAQITIKLSFPPGIYTHPETSHEYALSWDEIPSPAELALGDISTLGECLEQVVYGDHAALRAALLDFAKRDPHIQAVAFMKIESPEFCVLSRSPRIQPPPHQIEVPPCSPPPWDYPHSTFTPEIIHPGMRPVPIPPGHPAATASSQQDASGIPSREDEYAMSPAPQFQSLVEPRSQNVLVK